MGRGQEEKPLQETHGKESLGWAATAPLSSPTPTVGETDGVEAALNLEIGTNTYI
jgi:hypothetical protein